MSGLQKKYLQLYGYLRDLARLRERVVRDLRDYEEVVFLHEIRERRGNHCILFDPDREAAGPEWIRFKKPPAPPETPQLPAAARGWVEPTALSDCNSEPHFPTVPPAALANASPEAMRRAREAFETFVAVSWRPWAELLREYNREMDIYKRLFTMHERARKFGEQYELLLGVGLLSFKATDKVLIRRHVLVAQAGIDFQPERGTFTVHEGGEGARLRVEIDMIQDLALGDADRAREKAEGAISSLQVTEAPFSPQVADVLTTFVHTLSPEGKFDGATGEPTLLAAAPSVYFCPALVLRKRGGRGMVAMLEEISRIIEHNPGIKLPILDDLVGAPVEAKGTAPADRPGPDPEVFFPKPCNSEQMEILKRCLHHDKVLVQGPPGTGKSHTIANIISHLLAQGSRVLVTAYTKRALAVLKGLLPDAVKPLCVNLLGSDRQSMDDLEASVQRINTTLNGYDAASAARRIEELKAHRKKLHGRMSSLREELVQRMARDTAHHDLANGYSGTLLEIAQKISALAPSHGWLEDSVEDLDAATRVAPLVIELRELCRQSRAIDRREASLKVPAAQDLVAPGDFAAHASYMAELERYRRAGGSRRPARLAELLSTRSDLDVGAARAALIAARDACAALARARSAWAAEVAGDCAAARSSVWSALLKQTRRILSVKVLQSADQLDSVYEITCPGGDRAALRGHVSQLREFLAGGGKLQGPALFKPRSVREALKFMSGVALDGRGCLSPGALDRLWQYLELEGACEKLRALWGQRTARHDSAVAEIAEFVAAGEELESLLDASQRLVQAEQAIAQVIGLANFVHPCDGSETRDMEACLGLIDSYRGHRACMKALAAMIRLLSDLSASPQRHPVVSDLLAAAEKLDPLAYEKCHATLSRVWEAKQLLHREEELYTAAKPVLPRLADSVTERSAAPSAGFDLPGLLAAFEWSWARGKCTRLMDSSGREDLSSRLMQAIREEQAVTEELGASMAWRALDNSISKEQRAHLVAWYQAVKKIGKGTGRNAEKYRKVARSEMSQCRQSIPAWIMPLYQVAETVSPQPGVFDYVVIDEASQLGAEAISLLFLARKILIVGDDKQTAPENVGLSKEPVNQLIEKHLGGIPFKDHYGIEFSFFDHAERFCEPHGSKVVLREHFRCMPEIIDFSNRYFYEPFGAALLPMRQYLEKRLPPLRSQLVAGARCVRSGTDVSNQAEAEALVEEVERCCHSPDYEGMTFGIVALQGTDQAKRIERLLLDRLGAEEMERRSLVCGNAASFQGDERDVMFLSMVVAPDHSFRALTGDADKRRFNVAASRARDQVWLFHSITLEDLSKDDLRYQLLDHFKAPRRTDGDGGAVGSGAQPGTAPHGEPPRPYESWFEVEVAEAIRAKGFPVKPQYPVGHYRIDLVVVLSNGIRIGVECDGDKHGDAEQYERDIQRQLTLERCGWSLYRIRGADFYFDREAALGKLWARLRQDAAWSLVGRSAENPAGPVLAEESIAEPVEVTEVYAPPSAEPAGAQTTVESAAASEMAVSPDGQAVLDFTLEFLQIVARTSVRITRRDVLRAARHHLPPGHPGIYSVESMLEDLGILKVTAHATAAGTPPVYYELLIPPSEVRSDRVRGGILRALEGKVVPLDLETASEKKDEEGSTLSDHEGGTQPDGVRVPRSEADGEHSNGSSEWPFPGGWRADAPDRVERLPRGGGAQPRGPSPHTVEWFRSIAAETWFALAHETKENKRLTGWERAFVFNMGKLSGRASIPTEKQLAVAWKLYNKALGKAGSAHVAGAS